MQELRRQPNQQNCKQIVSTAAVAESAAAAAVAAAAVGSSDITSQDAAVLSPVMTPPKGQEALSTRPEWFTNEVLRASWGTAVDGKLDESSGASGAYVLVADPEAILITQLPDRTALIAFPGTRSGRDWVVDATFSTQELADGWIPCGKVMPKHQVCTALLHGIWSNSIQTTNISFKCLPNYNTLLCS